MRYKNTFDNINKRHGITIYSSPSGIECHCIRIILAEKHIDTATVVEVQNFDKLPIKLFQFNPYRTLPMLLDRNLILYEMRIILEYLDERLPHPPLLPSYPIQKANYRLIMFQIEKEWYSLANSIIKDQLSKDKLIKATNLLTDIFYKIAKTVSKQKYFNGEQFTALDCFIIPLLWRQNLLGINLNKEASIILKEYKNRLYKLESVQNSITDDELAISLVK